MEFLAGLHPKVVHFPVALLLTYVLFEVLAVIFKKEFLSKGAHLLLLLGVLAALAATITGEQAEEAFEYFSKASGAVMELHEEYANYTLWFFAGLLVIRTALVIRKIFAGGLQYVIVVLAVLGAFLVFKTGEYGGEMVYKHGVGTQPKIQMEQEAE